MGAFIVFLSDSIMDDFFTGFIKYHGFRSKYLDGPLYTWVGYRERREDDVFPKRGWNYYIWELLRGKANITTGIAPIDLSGKMEKQNLVHSFGDNPSACSEYSSGCTIVVGGDMETRFDKICTRFSIEVDVLCGDLWNLVTVCQTFTEKIG